jgi:hypothetical protein
VSSYTMFPKIAPVSVLDTLMLALHRQSQIVRRQGTQRYPHPTPVRRLMMEVLVGRAGQHWLGRLSSSQLLEYLVSELEVLHLMVRDADGPSV